MAQVKRPSRRSGQGRLALTRGLAAILAADIAGYSRQIGADEEGTLVALRAIWAPHRWSCGIDPSPLLAAERGAKLSYFYHVCGSARSSTRLA